MRKFFNEFKTFLKRGNVVDLAVGIIIGSAFTAIVNSLVKDIITPLIVWATPVDSLADLSIVLKEAQVDEAGEIIKEALTWNYGNFIQAIINFFIIGLVVFTFVKFVNKSKNVAEQAKKRLDKNGNVVAEQAKEEPKKEPKPTQEDYLKEIVELLKKQNNVIEDTKTKE